jgi:hypothetical protein
MMRRAFGGGHIGTILMNTRGNAFAADVNY